MANFEIGKQYYGFCLKQRSVIEDIHSVGYLFEHTQSGAKLFYIKNEDDNKVFFISFKTPPSDDCGTPHILEHSVLCGSRKYQAKDPFNELAKGSLNTYLNALTYADKTMYPIASRNEKDFMNMMDVYLDAVFYPRIYDKKEIFMQEGWHYVLEKDTPLSVSGVVYNEMKGALSDPESILSNAISRSLFPTTTYGFESGGNPEDIPNLTYENFLKFHKKYYHPSNSYIYLYGDMEIEKQLEWIDKEYLSHFEKEEIHSNIALESDFLNTVFLEDSFSVTTEEEKLQNTFLSYNVRVGKSTDTALILAFDMLSYILLETNASPLKKALIDVGIAQETEGWFDSSSYDMVFSIVAKKSEKQNLDLFQKVIENTLRDIVKNGLDKKLIEATLNRWEFYLKEEYFGQRPKGLTYGMKMMKSWLHGENPMDALRHWKHFDTVKTALTTNYFESLIQTLLIENTNKSVVVVSPEKEKQSNMERDFAKKMEQIKNNLSEQQKNELIEQNKALQVYQSKEDSEEVLKQIPFLHIDEISKNADVLQAQKVSEQCIFTPLNTNGIIYSQILFDISSVSQELLPYVGLLSAVIGKLDTKQYSFEEMPLEINFYTGGISFSTDIYSRSKQSCCPFITVNGKVLHKNLSKLFEIVKSMLFDTDFSKKENLKKIIKTEKINIEGYLQNSPHLAGIVRSMSHIAVGSKIKEQVSGVSYYHELLKIEQQSEKDIDDVISKLKQVYFEIFTKQNMLAAVACEEYSLCEYKKELQILYDMLPDRGYEKKAAEKENIGLLDCIKEALSGSSKVQYNVQSGNFEEYGYHFSGELDVLKTVLNLQYLWNTVRVQGGAYGCYSQFLRNGSVYFYSYRDPNIQKTYQAYQKTGEFLKEFCKTNTDFTKYILGTINHIDRPLSNAEKADLALARYLNDVSPELVQKQRDEILNTTAEKLEKYIPLLDEITKNENICTIGSDYAIQSEKEIFSQLFPYFPTVH